MSRFDDGNNYDYEDVFVFEDLVYTTVGDLSVVHVYRSRRNSLIKLHVHDVRYPCKCKPMYLVHSIVVTKDHIIQCCAVVKLVSVLDRYGELYFNERYRSERHSVFSERYGTGGKWRRIGR